MRVADYITNFIHNLGIKDIYRSYFYQPLHKAVTGISLKIKNIQSGHTNAYILYIFIALILSLFFIL